MTKAISQTGSTVILVLLVLAAAVLAPAAPLAAQQRAQPPEREFEGEVTVSEVLLDVLVTDKKGQVIIGLGPDDFVVRENGEEVPITGVTFYSNSRFVEPGDSAQAKGLEIDRVPVDRYFVLFFHDQRRDFAPRAFQTERQLLDAARKASEWILNEMLPTDWVAVASYDVKLRLHQDFTHDKQALLSALDDAAVSKGGENWPSRIGEGDGPSLAQSLPQGKALSKETRTIYEALTLLAEAAGEVVGRKNLVLFSRGFGDVGPGGVYQPDPRYYGDMEQALNDNNVAVYSVDLTPSEIDHTMAAALNQLAAETGGRYYFNFTTFAIPLRRIADENSGYYLLSYESRRPAGESGFQKVEVETTNPAFDVSARKGYAYGEGS